MGFSKSIFETANDISSSLFMGEVINNDDPKGRGRVRVAVWSMMDDDSFTGEANKSKEDGMPWYPILAPTSSSSNAGAEIPEVGSRVVVQFFDGDIYNGVVTGQISSKPAG